MTPGKAVSLCGSGHDAVLELLRSRRGCSAPPPSSNGRKLALLVEGGGMRGVSSAGGLVALDALGLRNAFDAIYASSAGAMNVAYMLSGQAVYGIQIYYKYVNNRNFINFTRLNKIVDIDYLFDTVVTNVRPLDVAKVLQARSDFFIGIVNKATGELFVPRAQDHPGELLAILKASTAVPVAYNRGVAVGSGEFIDGGLGVPVPFDKAVEDGCTDLLVYLTLPLSYSMSEPPRWERYMFNRFFAPGNRVLQEAFDKGYRASHECRQVCLGELPAPGGVNIATFCPSNSATSLSRTTTNGKRLKQSAVELAMATLEQFGEEPELVADLQQS